MEQQPDPVFNFLGFLKQSISKEQFVKMTISKAASRNQALRNVYGRLINIKGEEKLSFTLRFKDRDEVHNFGVDEGVEQLQSWLGNDFLNADLFTTNADYSLLFNKKRRPAIFQKAPSFTEPPDSQHDRQKKRFIPSENNAYLQKLGITSMDGKVLKKGQKKYRQINKYIEIIAALIRQHPLPENPEILDIGSGKGYLTFALYDYLNNWKGLNSRISGIELRENLVSFCNDLAGDAGFDRLSFLARDVEDHTVEKIDMLIALHACDTATDVALAKGITGQAEIIIAAPCCHRQIRKQMDCQNELKPILKYGILEERQAEILTDGIRALLLEAHGYRTKVFEFISTEHTSKNLMITAVKDKKNKEALERVKEIKSKFNIEQHYLEKLLEIG